MIALIVKVLEEGNCGRGTDRGEEACEEVRNRRVCIISPPGLLHFKAAIHHARSRQGYWRMSKTIASGVGLTNAWLAEQGLLSMKTLSATLAHLRGNALHFQHAGADPHARCCGEGGQQ